MFQTQHIAFTNIGKRERNEDAIFPAETTDIIHDETVFVLCDGVGGVPFGHMASQITAQVLYNYLKFCRQEQIMPAIEAGVQNAVTALHQYKAENVFATGLNTTMTACFLPPGNGKAFLYHLGDSKIYLIRNGQIHYRSTDHNVYNSFLREGIPMEENNRLKNRLTRVIKPYNPDENIATAHTQIEDLQANDLILLCTDGVTECHTDEQILEILANDQTDLCLKSDTLYQHCLQHSNDNFSAMLIQINQTTEPA